MASGTCPFAALGKWLPGITTPFRGHATSHETGGWVNGGCIRRIVVGGIKERLVAPDRVVGRVHGVAHTELEHQFGRSPPVILRKASEHELPRKRV